MKKIKLVKCSVLSIAAVALTLSEHAGAVKLDGISVNDDTPDLRVSGDVLYLGGGQENIIRSFLVQTRNFRLFLIMIQAL